MSTTSAASPDERGGGGFGWLPRGDEPGAAALRDAKPDETRAPGLAPGAFQPPPAPRRADPATVQTVINWGLAALLCLVGAVVIFETARTLRTSGPSGTLSTNVTPTVQPVKVAPTSVPRPKGPAKAVAPVTATTQAPVTTPATTTPQTSPPQTSPPRTSPPATTPAPVLHTLTTTPATTPVPVVVPTTSPSGPSDTVAVPVGPTP